MAVAPVLLGMMDVRTALIASVAGAIPSLLFWRQTIEPSTAPRFVAALALLLLGTVASARLLGDPAAFAYLGGWLFANGVMRLATGYRETPNSSVW
jgi:uncharacterized membrane protein HdeD (DUF308 family)